MLDKERLINLLGHSEIDDLKDMLCKWLDCGCTDPKTPSSTKGDDPTPIIILKGSVQADGYYFMVNIEDPTANAPQGQLFQLDTGAFEMLLTSAVADALHLPNDGPLDISGVTGSSSAYQSHVTVLFSDTVIYPDVPCVVDPSFTGTPLFGFRFFIDNAVALAVNPVQATLTLTHA